MCGPERGESQWGLLSPRFTRLLGPIRNNREEGSAFAARSTVLDPLVTDGVESPENELRGVHERFLGTQPRSLTAGIVGAASARVSRRSGTVGSAIGEADPAMWMKAVEKRHCSTV